MPNTYKTITALIIEESDDEMNVLAGAIGEKGLSALVKSPSSNITL